MNYYIYKILKEWKKEAGFEYPLLFKYNYKDNTITIFASQPGWFIGKAGVLVYKYQDKLRELFPGVRILFIETARYTI